ncbi:MAG: ATP-binding cassette domain-containing protein [Spirochaetes bacterium]|nr:ATP-binding cassette domain-containing protein [Spirochaetota bacterium]
MKHVVMLDIYKAYSESGTQANCGACLELKAGTIHAIVGENGAGKTTLMKILAGLERPDSGRILVDDIEVEFGSPADAARLGIGMVHQHFMIIPGFTAAENVVFGAEPRRANFFLDGAAAIARAREEALRYGFSVDPAKQASELSVGERQQVEILRLLHRDGSILILDEPTSVLTEQETKVFFGILRSLAARGKIIVLVSHKIREVLKISDKITVMRRGKTLGEFPSMKMTETKLSALVMGRKPVSRREPVRPWPPEVPVLVFDSVVAAGKHRGPPKLDHLSFSAFPGRILGLCALAGNGLAEVEEMLAGKLRPSKGRIGFKGGAYPRLRKAPWLEGGIGYVPSDRVGRGSCPGVTIWENFAALDRKGFFPMGMVDGKRAKKVAASAIAGYSIQAAPDSTVGELSGGNIQRMILARELSDPPPELLVLCEPSWGLDLTATDHLYGRIEALKAKGSTILLISSNLDEILGLTDEIIVLHEGKTQGRLANSPDLSRESLGALMLGLESRETAPIAAGT